MTLFLSNTLSGDRERFEPHDPDSVLLYTCGLTVSDDAHLGHARLWLHADVLDRWLTYLGYDVHHVQNFTDVNEKIVARIGEDDLGDSEPVVARHYIESVIEDMRNLNLRRAEVYPRVSEHVPDIVSLIESLIERGYAYESEGSVYFDVTTFEDYGKLSNQDIDEMESQGPDEERQQKRNPSDFALWKEGVAHPDDAEPGGETWESPWGEGRPGWHIECSAMSMTHLDDSIDIHVGGQDLVFPHHENEIAQSEAATGEQFAKYWMHVRLLETAGEKMSTSLENFFTVKNAIREFGMNAVRTFLVSTSYRHRQTYSEETISEAVERWENLERAHERAVESVDSPDALATVEDADLRSAVETARHGFEAAMNDDLNTREAISALLELGTAVNRHVDGSEIYDYSGLREAIETFEGLGGDVLGFVFTGEAEGDVQLAEDLVELVLTLREEERAQGNYERADELRDELESIGVEVQDTDDGPTFRF